MAIDIKMPQLSDTMDKGTILTWLVKEGETVSRGDALAEVATDKADLEIESFYEGTLLKIHSPEGSTVQVGDIIAIIGEQGEQVADSAPAKTAPVKETEPVVETKVLPPQEFKIEEPQVQPVATASQVTPSSLNGLERIKISPLAKNIAASHGLDFSTVTGTGEGGRIVKKDILNAIGQASEQTQPSGPAQNIATTPVVTPSSPQQSSSSQLTSSQGAFSQETKSIPMSKMRSAIATQMVKSVTEMPHFYVTSRIEVDEMIRVRASLKPLPQYEGITYTHMLIKACGLALRKVPRINACFKDGSLVEQGEVNVGIITALPDGLLIPVLKDADSSSLAEIVSDSKALVQRARSARPKPNDLVGGTFAISNMGRYDVESFTAIINPNHGAILAVSGIQQEPVVKGASVVPGNVMRLTLSCDHRIIDGLVAGEFLTELKKLIEDPILLLA